MKDFPNDEILRGFHNFVVQRQEMKHSEMRRLSEMKSGLTIIAWFIY